MPTEIFRFMTIRPPQNADRDAATNTVDLSTIRNDFLGLLAQQKKAESRPGMERLARAFVANDPAFIDSRLKVDGKLLQFYDELPGIEARRFLAAARERFVAIIGSQPADFVDRNEFRSLLDNLTNSIVAAAIDQSVSSKTRSLLVGLAQTVGLIIRLAKSTNDNGYSLSDFFDQTIVLPEGIFPLPTTKQDLKKHEEDEKERRRKAAEDQRKSLELVEELAANRAAITDILASYEKFSFTPGRPVAIAAPSTHGAIAPGGFVLPEANVADLSPETRKVLKKGGLEGSVDVARATALIERKSTELSNKLYANKSAATYLVHIGSGYLPSDRVVHTGLITGVPSGQPGPCPPAPASVVDDKVSVPLWTAHGEARALGFADLMLVEQDLLRYELGEIAHIENVLIGELREREFRTATTTEQSTLTETETTEEKTKDLTSTERFELQTESEKVINDSRAIQTGVTVNASYGPSVDVTANFNYTSNTAKQSSNRASTTFARDTTTKATNKIQTRTLERRFTRTVNEIEEKNRHSFKNRDNGAEHISGVYRFVDKIYNAQVVNYGKRFMLEFVVPEPAAFLRHALTRQPAEGVAQTKPDPPGYCRDGSFVPLQPEDICPETYVFWASQYLAEDVTGRCRFRSS